MWHFYADGFGKMVCGNNLSYYKSCYAQVKQSNCIFFINYIAETQVLLPLLKSDIYATLMEAVSGELSSALPSWHRDRVAVGVVMASGGYPGPYKKGCPITGLDCLQVKPKQKQRTIEQVYIYSF